MASPDETFEIYQEVRPEALAQRQSWSTAAGRGLDAHGKTENHLLSLLSQPVRLDRGDVGHAVDS